MEVFRILVSLLFSWAAIFHQWLACWFSVRNHSLPIWETSSSSIPIFIITVCTSWRTRRNKILKIRQSQWGKFPHFGEDYHFLLRFWMRTTSAVSRYHPRKSFGLFSPQSFICKMGSSFSATGSGDWKHW